MKARKGFLVLAVVVVLSLVSVGAFAAEKGLVAHFAFEGNLIDNTGNFAAGQVIGNLIGPSPGEVTDQRDQLAIDYAAGKTGQALKFDGTKGVLLPTGLIENDTYTIELLIYPEALAQHTTTFYGAVSGSKWISLVPDGPTTHYTMLWSGEAWYDATIGMTIPLNKWSRITATVDKGNVAVYLDGMEQFSGTGFPQIFSGFTGDAVFSLGVNWWDAPFVGMLDELKIYDRVLTAKEIR